MREYGAAGAGNTQRAAVSRREVVLLGAGAAGLTGALAACGDGSNGAMSGGGSDSETGGGGASGEVLGQASDIPVGGGTVFSEQRIVVTQPEEGRFEAFSAVCTHQGCTVASVSNGTIQCPCHGSQFSAADGSVESGPASQPLPGAEITVEDGEIRTA